MQGRLHRPERSERLPCNHLPADHSLQFQAVTWFMVMQLRCSCKSPLRTLMLQIFHVHPQHLAELM